MWVGISGLYAKADPVMSPRATGAGGCSNLPGDKWTVLANPAGLADNCAAAAGLMCSGDYLIPELASGYLSLYIPSSTGNFGFAIGATGNRYFNKTNAILGFSRKIGNSVNAGIGFNFTRFHQAGGYGTACLTVPSAGIILWPDKVMSLSFYIYNPAEQKVPGDFDAVTNSRLITCGLSVRLGNEAIFCSEVACRSGAKITCRSGIEYYATEVFSLRAGISFGTRAEPTAGLSIRQGKATIDIGLRRHPILGFSPSASIMFDI